MRDLSSNNQKLLLQTAREAIRAYLEEGVTAYTSSEDEELDRHLGCFVTLKSHGTLRGCVGTFSADASLFENVQRMARSAATQDSRFVPLRPSDLKDTSIEISVLTTPHKVASLEDVEVGRHGVIVRLGERSGTLLPQVATEQGWSREEFVLCCAREKAGLSPEECSRAEILVYEVQSFSDE